MNLSARAMFSGALLALCALPFAGCGQRQTGMHVPPRAVPTGTLAGAKLPPGVSYNPVTRQFEGLKRVPQMRKDLPAGKK